MHALAGQGVEVHRQGRDQGLALTGLHLGDPAAVQGHAADQLYVEVTHAHHPLAGLAHGGKGFGQQGIERLTGRQTLTELSGAGGQRSVVEGFEARLELIDGANLAGHALDVAVVLGADDFTQQRIDHETS